jgi:hypothetical protein
VSPASLQYWLQYFSPFGTGQLQAGCAHIPFGLSAMLYSSVNVQAITMPESEVK